MSIVIICVTEYAFFILTKLKNTMRLIPQHKWIDDTFSLYVEGQKTTFTIQDCYNFHGYDALGGVALGFRLLQKAAKILSPDELLEREHLSLFTSFPGLGARDVFELTTRMVSDHRFELDTNFTHPIAQEGVAGAFYFCFQYKGKTVELAPVDGSPSKEFIRVGKQTKVGTPSVKLMEEWTNLKSSLANTLLQHTADDVIRRLS